MTTVVMASGGFDPLHSGHVRYLNDARRLGTQLVVAINCDAWLIRKKGAAFMDADERLEIVSALRCVDHAFILESEFNHVGEAIMNVRPHVFAKGGDRCSLLDLPIAEVEACRRVGARIEFNIGGGKIQSSSALVKRAGGDSECKSRRT